MGVLTELDITGPMPLVLNAPALANQSQQGFWSGAHTGHEPMIDTLRLPLRVVVVISCTIQALPGQLAMMCSGASLALRSQGLAAVPCLHIRCCERDAALSLELVVDLPAEDLLILFDAQ